MESSSSVPFSIYPEYLKGGVGHHSGDNNEEEESAPSGDITLIVPVVDTYEEDDSYSSNETFMDNLFTAYMIMTPDHDTISRG